MLCKPADAVLSDHGARVSADKQRLALYKPVVVVQLVAAFHALDCALRINRFVKKRVRGGRARDVQQKRTFAEYLETLQQNMFIIPVIMEEKFWYKEGST